MSPYDSLWSKFVRLLKSERWLLFPDALLPAAAIGQNTLSSSVFLLLIGHAALPERRRAALCAFEREKKRLLQKWLSIREKWGGQREKKTRSGSTEKRVKQHTASKTPSPAALPGWHSPPKVCRCVSSHSWDYFGHLVSLRSAVNTDVCIFSSSSFYFFWLFCFAALDGRSGFFAASPHLGWILWEMSERRRSAAALSSRAHAFSVEALIGSNKKRKLRGWEEKELELSMESLATDGEDPAHCLDMDPGQCADTHNIAQMSLQSTANPQVPSQNVALCSMTQPRAEHTESTLHIVQIFTLNRLRCKPVELCVLVYRDIVSYIQHMRWFSSVTTIIIIMLGLSWYLVGFLWVGQVLTLDWRITMWSCTRNT